MKVIQVELNKIAKLLNSSDNTEIIADLSQMKSLAKILQDKAGLVISESSDIAEELRSDNLTKGMVTKIDGKLKDVKKYIGSMEKVYKRIKQEI